MIDEVTNKRQIRRLVVLPYDIKVKEVFPENILFVTEFSKKTGDYASLSSTDIKVIALTYQLEKELVGTEHLKQAPTVQKTIVASAAKPSTNSVSTIEHLQLIKLILFYFTNLFYNFKYIRLEMLYHFLGLLKLAKTLL